MADAQQGRAYDWPLSREEKKSRVLELYEAELQDTNQFLLSCDGSQDVNSLQDAAPFDAAVGMQPSPPERHNGPSPKDKIKGKDGSRPHADATSTQIRPLNADSEDLVQDHGHGRRRRNTYCAEMPVGSSDHGHGRHRRNTYCAERPVGSSNANSHARGRRRRRHSAACSVPPKEDGSKSVESKGGPLLLEERTASGRKHSASCLPPNPSGSVKPAEYRGHQAENSGPASPPPPGRQQHVYSANAMVKHKIEQPAWRPSVTCTGRMGSRCASAHNVTMSRPALKQQGAERLPHASWRPSLFSDRTPCIGGMAVGQIGVHGV